MEEWSEVAFTGERVVPSKVSNTLQAWHIKRYEFASQFVKDKIVLDVGCGIGYGTHFMKHAGAKEVVGIDVSEDAIKYAQTHFDAKYLRSDALKLPFLSESFNIIVSLEVIEHILPSLRKRFLLESFRLLKKGGLFICSTPNRKLTSSIFLTERSLMCRFHYIEFFPQEFKVFLKKYFLGVLLFGQCKKNIILAKAKYTLVHLLKITPFEKNLMPPFKKINTIIKKLKPKKFSLNTLHTFGIEPFEENFFRTYNWIIAVCRKSETQNTK